MSRRVRPTKGGGERKVGGWGNAPTFVFGVVGGGLFLLSFGFAVAFHSPERA